MAWRKVLTSVAADESPSLGGDLNVSGNAIISTSNGSIDINPHGTGTVKLCQSGSTGTGGGVEILGVADITDTTAYGSGLNLGVTGALSLVCTGVLTLAPTNTLVNLGSNKLWDGSGIQLTMANLKDAYDNRATDNIKSSNISVAFDGGGSAIAIGSVVRVVQYFANDLTDAEWALNADVSGSVTVKMYDCGSFDSAVTYDPDSINEITPAAGMQISSSTYATGDITSGNGWSVVRMAPRRVYRLEVTACSTITQLTVSLMTRKNPS